MDNIHVDHTAQSRTPEMGSSDLHSSDQSLDHPMDLSESGSLDLACSGDQKAPAKGSNYQRRPKPPYSYIALIAMAIRDSESKKLTLAEINDYLMKKFPFFRGEYTGWRNSVRHNLSLNECFKKVLRDPNRPWGKDNYWMLNESSDYTFADGVFRRRRKRLNQKKANKLAKDGVHAEKLTTGDGNSGFCRTVNKFSPEPKQGVIKAKLNSFLIDNLLGKSLSSSEDESSCLSGGAVAATRSPSPKSDCEKKQSISSPVDCKSSSKCHHTITHSSSSNRRHHQSAAGQTVAKPHPTHLSNPSKASSVLISEQQKKKLFPEQQHHVGSSYPFWPGQYLHSANPRAGASVPVSTGWNSYAHSAGNMTFPYPFLLPQALQMHTSFNPHSIDMSQHLATISQLPQLGFATNLQPQLSIFPGKNGHPLYNVVGL